MKKFKLGPILKGISQKELDEKIVRTLNSTGVSKAFGIRKQVIRMNINYKIVVKDILSEIVRTKSLLTDTHTFPSKIMEAFAQSQRNGKVELALYSDYKSLTISLISLRSRLKEIESFRKMLSEAIEKNEYEQFKIKQKQVN